MVLGKILWFGGKNHKGRVKNFGFIEFYNFNLIENIYVNRQNISGELQNICDDDCKRGEGIWVVFEIKDCERGKQAINVDLYQEFGVVITKNSFLKICQICTKSGSRYSLSNVSSVNVGDIIKFSIRESETNKENVLILLKINLQDIKINTIQALIKTPLKRSFINFQSIEDNVFILDKQVKEQAVVQLALPSTKPQFSNKCIVQPTTSEPETLRIIKEDLGDGVILELVQLPGGQFMMGASDDDNKTWDSEKPQHLVKIKSFAIGKYPITQEQYQKLIGKNPSCFQGNPNNPVEQVNWYDAQILCQKLSQFSGKKYRLASEAEWEYACRAGTNTRYFFGDNLDDKNQIREYAWFNKNSGGRTHIVGQKKPNHWGLYDMHGNIWEWCEDTWHPNYRGAPVNGSAWIDDYSQNRIIRGGSWHFYFWLCRSGYRKQENPNYRVNRIGFRIVCSLNE